MYQYLSNVAEALNQKNNWGIHILQDTMLTRASSNTDKAPIIIRILSIFGGFVGAILLAVSLNLIFQFSTASHFVLGILFFIGGLYINKKVETLFLDTMGLALIFIGLFMFGYSFLDWFDSDILLSIIYFILGLFILYFLDGIVMAFAGIGLMLGTFAYLCFENSTSFGPILFTGLLTISLYIFIEKEYRALSQYRQHIHKYSAVLVCMILAMFVSIYVSRYMEVDYWVLGIVPYMCLLLFIQNRLTNNPLANQYFYMASIILLPLVGAPGIIASIFVLVMSYHIQHKLAIGLGILSLIFFIGDFYFNLQFSLLIKSLLLMASGAMLLGMFAMTRSRWSS
jgi:hypothetical protein